MTDRENGSAPGEDVIPAATMSEEEFAALRAAKRASKKRRKPGKEGVLNITSLMDAMTILLVFLLVSMVSDPLNVKQDEAMRMARASSEDKPASDTITIQISKEFIIVDHEKVADIECIIEGSKCTRKDMGALNDCEANPAGDICNKKIEFKISKQDKENANPNSLVIVPLKKVLDKQVKRQIEQLEMRENKKFEGVATLIVDKEIPFRLLTEVIYTAGRVGDPRKGGLAKFRFAVMKM
ncbi:MAG: biopolymer transporter ExbD [Deltaproteobacteria bacterium]|nr:biopolymer transporter ExbD [Deltaproteobacteria bacterium]